MYCVMRVYNVYRRYDSVYDTRLSGGLRVSWWLNTQYSNASILWAYIQEQLCYKVTPPSHMAYLATFLRALEPCNFTTMMTKFFPIVSVLICAFVTVRMAAVYPQNCGEAFESQLKELLAIKKTCDSAAFYDCCQVKRIIANII